MLASDHPPDPEADSHPPGGRRTGLYLAVLLAVVLVMGLGDEWFTDKYEELVVWYQERTDPPATTTVEERTVEPLLAATALEPGEGGICLEWEPGDPEAFDLLGDRVCRTWSIATTTLPAIESAQTNLRIALVLGGGRAALIALADAYEAMVRALDDNDQAAIIAWWNVQRSDNRDLVDDVEEAAADTLDSLDVASLNLGIDAHRRLQDRLSLNPPIHVPKTNPDQGDLRDPPLTGSCSSSQDRTILTNSYRRRSGGISTISPCPLRAPNRWIQAKCQRLGCYRPVSVLCRSQAV